MLHSYEHARPSVTVDCAVFGLDGDQLSVLLVERAVPPFEGCWALPGGFVGIDEDLEAAARRELEEETGIALTWLEQLYTFGAPDRDPRGRVITVAFYALVKTTRDGLRGSTDARDARWFPADAHPALAFDHDAILAVARARLRSKVSWQPVGFELLPERFTLTQLQQLYETVLGRSLDKRNFRRKVLALGLLAETEVRSSGPGRPARLYRFDRDEYARLEAEGFVFEL